jgi:uncharacterized protein (DUF1501 family)
MLRQLGDAIAAFFEDVRPMRRNVTMLVLTEFGRTNEENGNRGTDHGHGGLMFVAGGSLKGKRVHGDWTGLAPGKTYENRDLAVTTDFRTVMLEIARGPLGLSPDKTLFPRFTPERALGLFA